MTSFANINMKAGKVLYKNSPGVSQTFFGVDFNPNLTAEFTGTGDSTNVYVNETATIDCSSLTNGHEVVVGLYKFQNDSGSTQTNNMGIRRQKLVGGTRTTIFDFNYGNKTLANGEWGYIYAYIGIDYDEIWSGGSYRVQGTQNGYVLITSMTYNMSNVNPMSTLRTAGYVWVSGSKIHYIDSSYNTTQGFEHIISNTGYGLFVGEEKAGSIRVEGNKLGYVDENGYKRYTHSADSWKTPTYVGTDSAGYIRVSNGQSEYDGYAYLCFIGSDGYKYRIMNGTVT